jgi:hypothetical protein
MNNLFASITNTGQIGEVQTQSQIQANVKAILVVLGILVGLVVLSLLFGSGSTMHSSSLSDSDQVTKSLIKEAAQWSTVAQQDSNPLLALVHSTYGTAYLNIARHLGSDDDIARSSNLNLGEFRNTLSLNQQAAMRALLAQCPMMAPAGIAALQTGWVS